MRGSRVAMGIVGVAVLVLASIFAVVYADNSTYAPGFNQAAFDQIEEGMTRDEVYQLLGSPLSEEQVDQPEIWRYGGSGSNPDPASLTSSGERVFSVEGDLPISVGVSRSDVVARVGNSERVYRAGKYSVLHYSHPPEYGRYEARIVRLDPSGIVVLKSGFSTFD